MDKKQAQLGMNPSTASNRLVKDLLYKLVVDTNRNDCYRCGGKMTRETFSIEHKEAWLDSDNPVQLFFDTDNIAFSHISCNIGAARKTRAECGSPARYAAGCKCTVCKDGHASRARKRYTPERRAHKYERTGH